MLRRDVDGTCRNSLKGGVRQLEALPILHRAANRRVAQGGVGLKQNRLPPAFSIENLGDGSNGARPYVGLFIGWGEVASSYYYPILMDFVIKKRLSIIVAETPQTATAYPGHFVAWESAEFDTLLRKGRLTHIFILTPPALHMEQLTYCLKRLAKVDHTIAIFVEKPTDFEPIRVHEALRVWLAMENRSRIVVRQIDHYAQKWSIRMMRERMAEVVRITGKLREIIFFSAEKRHIPSSPTFARGYAIEHGVHAWSILSQLFPEVMAVQFKFDAEKGRPCAWRYKEATPSCLGETAFLFRFIALQGLEKSKPLTPDLTITIAGGKALGIDKKVLVLMGEDGVIVADLLQDQLISTVGRTKQDLFKDAPAPRIPAYRAILEGIFGEHSVPLDVTLPIEAGLWSIERIYAGISAVESLGDYQAGTMPPELADLASGLDNTKL